MPHAYTTIKPWHLYLPIYIQKINLKLIFSEPPKKKTGSRCESDSNQPFVMSIPSNQKTLQNHHFNFPEPRIISPSQKELHFHQLLVQKNQLESNHLSKCLYAYIIKTYLLYTSYSAHHPPLFILCRFYLLNTIHFLSRQPLPPLSVSLLGWGARPTISSSLILCPACLVQVPL